MRSKTKCPNCEGDEFSSPKRSMVECTGCRALLSVANHPPAPSQLPDAVVVTLAKLEREHDGVARICPRSEIEQRTIDRGGAVDAWMVEVGKPREQKLVFIDPQGRVSEERPVPG